MRRQIRWKKWLIGITSLCILVWMTWFFGYTYVRMVTQSKNLTKPTPSAQEQGLLNLSSLEFWTCQIGVFQSEENALQEKKRLDQLGWEAQILSQNPWSVSIGFAHTQEELALIREHLKEGGIVSVSKNIKIPERAYRIRGTNAEQTARILEAVHSFLNGSSSSKEQILSQLEKELIIPGPKGLSKLQEAGLIVIKAERTLQEDMRKIVTLRLLAEYLGTLETLKK